MKNIGRVQRGFFSILLGINAIVFFNSSKLPFDERIAYSMIFLIASLFVAFGLGKLLQKSKKVRFLRKN